MCFCYSDSGWKLASIGFSFDKITKATKTELADQNIPDSRDTSELHGF